MANNRSKNALINIVIIVIMQITSFVYSLIIRNLALEGFGISIYGVLDLFDSFFSSLTTVEVGFGVITVYNFYKPLAKNDMGAVKKQLSLSQTVYTIINIFVLFVSAICLPFIYKIFNISYNDKLFVYIVYISYIIKVLVVYHFTSKATLITAGQYTYIHNLFYLVIDLICFILKIVSIKYLNCSYLFAILTLIGPTLAYIVDTFWVNKKYSLNRVKCVSIKELKQNGIFSQYIKYIPATLYKLAFNSTDNLIISNMLSTDAVAYTSNYNSIFSTAYILSRNVLVSIRGVMADYTNNSDNDSDVKDMFNVVSSLNFVFISLMCVGLYSMMDDFISLCYGGEYIISRNIMLACLLIKMIDALFEPVATIFQIKGYMFKERWPLIISALTNFILTIIFIKWYGLIGAYIATIIALVIKWIGKFYYILTGVFENYKLEILNRNLLFVLLIGTEMYFVNILSSILVPNVTNVFLFILKMLVVTLVVCTINGLLILFNKSTRDYFKYTVLKRKKYE